MSQRFANARLLTGAATAAALAVIGTPAWAQATTEATQGSEPAAQASPPIAAQANSDDEATPEVVVTGSLFRRDNKQTALPVTVVTADSLERAGITNTADAVRQVAADGAGSIGVGFTSGFSAGGSAVSLRNLGVSSTLLLVNGLRSANFPLSDDGHNSYADLTSIPQVNVERIEVLKDGASSLYGADAIGGVVNIITRRQVNGIEGGAEAGVTQEGDGHKYRFKLLGGFGDYSRQGWNFYVGGEYEKNGKITADSRGFPFNTLDLSSIGGRDNNRADDTLTTPTPNAVVTRVTQTDLNNPLAGSVANATTPALFTSLTPLANCPFGTFSENTSARVGTACAHDLTKEYVQIQPPQERFAGVARFSYRVSDTIESYVEGSYSHNKVDITLLPRGIRQNQAFGGSPSTSTSNPGIVLPVYICSSGVNCATAADRQLNPNNPYAAAYANDPANGAARIYYSFGDVKAGSVRKNELIRVTGGLRGTIGDTWDWRVDAGYSRDNLDLKQTGFANLAGLVRAINTGSYNFRDPSANPQSVRDSVIPAITSLSDSTEITVDGSVRHDLFDLPGGPLQLAVGGQYRKEKLNNRSANPNLDVPGLSTAQAFGNRDVWAGFFEVNAPILDTLEVSASGRYDHYSEGFSHFSPKATFKFQPIRQLAVRGSFSEGFRAPTFAESNPVSSFSGFVGFNPGDPTRASGAAFRAAHAANAGYYANYQIGRGFVGNPDIEPETARSYSLGAVFEPTRWLQFTADYFHVKKKNLIVTGPLSGAAIDAYYSVSGQTFASAAAASAAGCAAVEAVAPGYSCNVIDGADPSALNALPRLLVLNAPYVNANYDIVSGLQFTAAANVPITNEIRLRSRLDLQETLKFNRYLDTGEVQRFTGTVGPADLSSGGGTPKWRGNWQNTLDYGRLSLTATTYFVGAMKGVATDQGNLDTSCAATLYKDADGGNSFCKIKRFVYTDLNATFELNEDLSIFALVGNVTNARAPLYANVLYTTQPNYLASWHMPGLIGRTFRAGVNFRF